MAARIKKWWHKRRINGGFKIKSWQLLVLLLPLGFAVVNLLRADHIRMTELRDAVLAADEAEDEELVAESLAALREFVYSNVVINILDENGMQRVTFGTGVFYLENMYLKAANAALTAAEENMKSDLNPNGNIYGMAGNVCKPLAIRHGWGMRSAEYINCMTNEINKYPASANLEDNIQANLPSTELYRHNYASPLWAPTATGWAILAVLIILVVIFIRLIVWVVLRLALLFL